MSTATRLGAALNGSLTSVEILPGDGKEWLAMDSGPADEPREFLLVEGNLGIPQKLLYKAYIEATLAFKKTRLTLRRDPHTIDAGLAGTVTGITAVLLVANAGHQSAWNARKQIVESGHRDLHDELSLLRALLTIRDCAKHSLLWHHRRWLLRQLCKRRATTDADSSDDGTSDEDTLRYLDMTPSQLRAEFDACALAATTYERNYFAWAHRARCLDALVSLCRGKDHEYLDILQEETQNVSLWIDRHVGDYTAMQYRCRLALFTHPLTLPPPAPESPYAHAKSLVEAYPEHESLWAYLRSAAQVANVSEDDIRPFAEKFWHQRTNVDSPASQASHRHAKRCLDWLSRRFPHS